MYYGKKYEDSSDNDIQDTLLYWKNNPISFFNQYEYTKETYYEVYWDESINMPYIWYENRKIYYPRKYPGFLIYNEKMYVKSYRDMEQHPLSPHRYLTQDIMIEEGDVVVDAGAMEGDFALPYIDIIDKLYIFECDSEWIKALECTYKDYKEKVVIIPKKLGNTVDEKTTTLKEIVGKNRINFIKMDIEGAEVNALSVSEEILQNNNIKCSICCYHNKNDMKEITNILQTNNYVCNVSNGYVVSFFDPNIFTDIDFRKCVIYAKNF